MGTPSDSRDAAIERLDAAKDARDRRAEQHDAVRETNGEVRAAAELEAAEDQLAAREAWLTWVDRDDR